MIGIAARRSPEDAEVEGDAGDGGGAASSGVFAEGGDQSVSVIGGAGSANSISVIGAGLADSLVGSAVGDSVIDSIVGDSVIGSIVGDSVIGSGAFASWISGVSASITTDISSIPLSVIGSDAGAFFGVDAAVMLGGGNDGFRDGGGGLRYGTLDALCADGIVVGMSDARVALDGGGGALRRSRFSNPGTITSPEGGVPACPRADGAGGAFEEDSARPSPSEDRNSASKTLRSEP